MEPSVPVGLTFLICELSSMIDCPTLVFKRSQMAGSPEHACPRPGKRGGGWSPGALQTGGGGGVEFDYMRQERMMIFV